MTRDNYIKLGNHNILNRKLIYLLSFFVPFFILLTIYIIRGIFPFGDRAFLRIDLYHQYLPFHSELQYKLKNLGSLFYTYDVGLGTNFLSLFAYYLSSPFNILLLLFNKKYIIDILGYFCIIKISLSGLTFSHYLIKRYKEDSLIIVFFAIFYALSGYIGAYYWNVMWLDNIILFPLLLLGFEDLFYKNDGKLYIIVLALSILCNYYIASMTCFFLILYFFYLIFYNNQINIKYVIKKLISIVVPSIISIMISAILLIPVFYAFNTTASSDMELPKSIYHFFSVFDAISRHMPLVEIENGTDNWPNIYCGIFILPLIIYYFISRKIKLRTKIYTFILILLFYGAFTINIFNFISHIFRYPNSLPSRFSFIYVALILTFGYISIYKTRNIDKEKLLKSIMISICFILLIASVTDKTKVSSYILAIFLLIIYMLTIEYGLVRKFDKNKLYIILLLLFSIEAFVNFNTTSITTVSRSDYLKNREDATYLKEYAKSINDDFYRIEIDKRKAKDDGAFLNFPSASIFSSSCYKDGIDFYEKLGMEASMNAYSVSGATPLSYAILGVKYELLDHKEEKLDSYNMRLLKEEGQMGLYEYIDTLPLSYVLNNDFLEKYDFGSGNPATAQNNISRAYGEKVVLEPIDIETNGIEASFNVKSEGRYFAFVLDKGIDDVIFQHGDTSISFSNVSRGYFLDLGNLNTNEKYLLTNDTTEKEIQVQVFKFNIKSMKNLIDKIKDDSSMHMHKFSDTYIEYDIDVRNEGKAIITLPYDDGWDIEVDGEKVEKSKVLDFFLGFDVDKGNHKVSMKYTPPGFYIGLILSIIGIVLMILYFKKDLFMHNIKRLTIGINNSKM